MNKINFARVDYRLIHGQVVTKWLKIAQAKSIVIVDDNLAVDSFMADIYKLSAPKGKDVSIVSADKAAEMFKNEELVNDVFLLFKTIDTVCDAYNKGLKLDELQIGGAPKNKDNIMVFSAVSLNSDDIKNLDGLEQSGVDINLQIVPEEPGISYKEARKRFVKEGGSVDD